MRDVGLARPVEKAKGAVAGNVAGLIGKASLNHKGPACLIRFLLAAYRRLVFKLAAMIFVPCPRIPCMAQDRFCAPVLLVAILPMEIRYLHRLDI
jgi:hypothetical protein